MGYALTIPKKLPFKNIKQVALGEAHTLILNKEGKVRAFGWGELGQLGA